MSVGVQMVLIGILEEAAKNVGARDETGYYPVPYSWGGEGTHL